MVSCEALDRGAPASRGFSIFALILLSLLPLSAGTKPAPALDSGYVSALSAADHFLQAWQTCDAESGLALLSGHAKAAATPNSVEKFFSSRGPSAYEINRGQRVKRGRYEFPIVLVLFSSNKVHVCRRFSSIVVVNAGDNDWAVDNLP